MSLWSFNWGMEVENEGDKKFNIKWKWWVEERVYYDLENPAHSMLDWSPNMCMASTALVWRIHGYLELMYIPSQYCLKSTLNTTLHWPFYPLGWQWPLVSVGVSSRSSNWVKIMLGTQNMLYRPGTYSYGTFSSSGGYNDFSSDFAKPQFQQI